MQYIELREKLSDYLVFSLQDIKKVDSSFYRARLNDWQNKGYIRKVRRGYYIFSDQDLDEPSLFSIANIIYSPSYVSFEMALSYYGLIPESVYGITCASSNKTSKFSTGLGEFIYHSIKPELMFGYRLERKMGVSFKIADIEKSVIDFFYINTDYGTDDDFSGLRFNAGEFKLQADRKKLLSYLSNFNNKSLEKRVNKFLTYIGYAID